MWAGSQFSFHAPLRVGDAISRVSTIADITEKYGRTGKLVFVKVRHEISRDGASSPAITEFHDIVYRDAPGPDDPTAPPPQPAPADAAWDRIWIPDDVLLFRYSALTFNGHRIHYDRRYVTEVEKYPGLIVHGPLIATLLLDGLRHEHPDAEIAEFRFRAVRPTFDTNRFSVHGKPAADGRTFHLWAKDHEGWLTMDATAVIR
jgi:3-methylfumaryl-CoA hydratase